ncbi:hypothetical protein MHN00_08930 [Alteromonas sp. Cnat2-8]|uniref:hypothetical protein n=1 Tax=Alteromonas sp. Cnat2-8 TaxID=2917728 RepID=UPI001EF71750|nr:hypothetical protein [Alteromonas sp. Cnat2-8]MCG7653677.1 hypothetical protein [Alteromonas sp. Cnat2-8]
MRVSPHTAQASISRYFGKDRRLTAPIIVGMIFAFMLFYSNVIEHPDYEKRQ